MDSPHKENHRMRARLLAAFNPTCGVYHTGGALKPFSSSFRQKRTVNFACKDGEDMIKYKLPLALGNRLCRVVVSPGAGATCW